MAAPPTFQRVVVPLDGSPLAERGLTYAVQFARTLAVPLVLLRVAAGEEAVSDGRRYLDDAAARLATEGLSTAVLVRDGDAVHEILAEERPGDLLVMTTHGATGLERFLLGSVTDRILRYCEAPLFLARAFKPPATLSPMLVPLDGSEHAEAVLPYVRLLASRLDAEVRLLRVVHTRTFDAIAYPSQIVEMTLEWERTEGARYIQSLVERLQRDGLRVTGQVREAEPYQAISEDAGRQPGGFIAMATHGRAGLARTLLGNVAAQVSELADDPVFLIKA